MSGPRRNAWARSSRLQASGARPRSSKTERVCCTAAQRGARLRRSRVAAAFRRCRCIVKPSRPVRLNSVLRVPTMAAPGARALRLAGAAARQRVSSKHHAAPSRRRPCTVLRRAVRTLMRRDRSGAARGMQCCAGGRVSSCGAHARFQTRAKRALGPCSNITRGAHLRAPRARRICTRRPCLRPKQTSGASHRGSAARFWLRAACRASYHPGRRGASRAGERRARGAPCGAVPFSAVPGVLPEGTSAD